jgi:hypothetical protein
MLKNVPISGLTAAGQGGAFFWYVRKPKVMPD